MEPITIMVFIAAALAAISLFNGISSMAHGGEADDQRAHILMFKRVTWQAIAAALVLVAAGLE